MTIDQNPLPTSARFLSALNYATTLHTESRKGTTIPYISHLYSVAALVMESDGSENEVIAALLHDAVEDHGGLKMLEKIRIDFGEAVANIVAGCSDDIPPDGQEKRPWRKRKEEYIEHIVSASHSVRLVSNADKLHNARCILKDYREIGEKIWDRFAGKKEGTLWYYCLLADVFLESPANLFLAEELDRVVKDLQAASMPRALSPPSDNIVERLSWDGMPVVVVRNPASGNLSAWSSSSPGKRWRTVDVSDVLSEARRLSESDWNSVFARWFTDS